MLKRLPPTGVFLDNSFPHSWEAEVLASRPPILPARHFVYPRQAEEVEHGALELLVRPPAAQSQDRQPFLATCALGFNDPGVPSGVWSTPSPIEICAVSGGYAYIVDTTAPHRFTMIPYRPVLQVLPLPIEGLLLFVSHRSILAWARRGQAWESGNLSDEGLTVIGANAGILRGLGWQMETDREFEFALDLRTGLRTTRP